MGKPPFRADNYMDLTSKIHSGQTKRISMRYSEDLERMIKQMIRVRPGDRPTVDSLLTHPYVDVRVRETKLKTEKIRIKREVKSKERELEKREQRLREREKLF